LTPDAASYQSRQGLMLLSNLGMADLVASTLDDYVRIAATLASDLPRLAALRAGLRQRMARSPITDGVGLTRKLEAAYQEMWARLG